MINKNLRIVNSIGRCDDGRARDVDVSSIRHLVFHRCSVGETAEEIATAFIAGDAGVGTGHQMPYHYVVQRDGTIEQALAVGDYGPHALSWSIKGIGVAVVGDFRKEDPTNEQFFSCLDLCTLFAPILGVRQSIWGHDELKHGSRDPNKECPGDRFNMNVLRRCVEETLMADLIVAGVVDAPAPARG